MKKIKVLVVDDSATVRMLLSKGLGLDPGLEVVGTAPDPYVARNLIADTDPDVITLDVEMPRMDGIEFLKRIMTYHPLPVIMVSALTEKGKRITLEALEAGAFDYVTKPSGSFGAKGLNEMLGELRTKIRDAVLANVGALGRAVGTSSRIHAPAPFSHRSALAETTDKVIAIGASTGGTTAIHQILSRLPADTPGIVLVQHISPGFSRMFAERLNEITSLQVAEARSGDRVLQGRVLVAPAGQHLEVVRSGGTYRAEVREGSPVSGHIPSVDVLFQSVSQSVGGNAIGVLLTGMGADGAHGLLAMRQAGARTASQDEASSVVYGMPKVAWELGASERQIPLDKVPDAILDYLSEIRSGKGGF